MTYPAIKNPADYIAQKLRERQVNKILHGFPSPRLWRPGDFSPRRQMLNELGGAASSRLASLYVGLPYCVKTDPGNCGYCLFPVEIFEGSKQIDQYLDVLAMEFAFKSHPNKRIKIDSIYVGGGTPNLLKPAQIERLFAIIRTQFTWDETSSNVTFEGIPQLFSLEKMRVLSGCGVTRVSMGVQQLDDQLNALSGRRQSVADVERASEWAHLEGLEVNLDLIFGWPLQDSASMLAGLRKAVSLRPEQIAHYELNIGGSSHFALRMRDKLPDLPEVRRQYAEAVTYLTGENYAQLTSYDFRLKSSGLGAQPYEECGRGFGPTTKIGFGSGAISDFAGTSDFPGFISMNQRRAQAYEGDLTEGIEPVELGFRRSLLDLKLQLVFANIQGLSLRRQAYHAAFGTDLIDDFHDDWAALENIGWVDVSSAEIRVTPSGSFYVPTMQSLLSRHRMSELSNELRSQSKTASASKLA